MPLQKGGAVPDFIGASEVTEALETRAIVNALVERISSRNILFNLRRPEFVGEALRQVYGYGPEFKSLQTLMDIVKAEEVNVDRIKTILGDPVFVEDIIELKEPEFLDSMDQSLQSAAGLMESAGYPTKPLRYFNDSFLSHFETTVLTSDIETKIYQVPAGVDYIIAYCIGGGGNVQRYNSGKKSGNGGNNGGMGGANTGGTAYTSSGGGSGGIWIQTVPVTEGQLIRYTIGQKGAFTADPPEGADGGNSYLGDAENTYPHTAYEDVGNMLNYLSVVSLTGSNTAAGLNGVNCTGAATYTLANAFQFSGVAYGQGGQPVRTNSGDPGRAADGAIILFEHQARG